MSTHGLPPLPPLKPRANELAEAQEVGEPSAELTELRQRCIDSAVPHVSENGVTAQSVCAICQTRHDWWETVWGKWNSGHKTLVRIPPRKGERKWRMFHVPVYVSGRTCNECVRLRAPEWRRVAEPPVTIDKRAEGAPQRHLPTPVEQMKRDEEAEVQAALVEQRRIRKMAAAAAKEAERARTTTDE